MGRSSTSLQAKKVSKAKVDNRTLTRRIFDLDLFAPKANQNDYGARKSKNIKVGGITKNSYVPNGLTKAQYEKVRRDEQRKKAENYERNVKKAGIFIDYTAWYKARGTDTKQDWKKTVTNGHRMAKTKYDWQGNENTKFSVWRRSLVRRQLERSK